MLMELNTTHIALIPKNKCPKDVTEYRPIACCNILYKCITKMICNRLKMVLPDLISENQGAFVHQRYILHNINRHKKSKRKHEGDDDVNDIHQHKKSKAETETERMEWVNKITGVIRSLLNSHLLEQMSTFPADEKNTSSSVTETMSNVPVSHSRNPSNDIDKLAVGVSQILREILGNDHCAECGAPDLDWASLNLGILICIECSGAHRNLGVHISKVSEFEDIPSAQAILVGTLAPGVNIVCNGEAKCSIKGPFLIIDEKTMIWQNQRVAASQ